MKKLISCVLVLALVLSLGVFSAAASAADAETVSMDVQEMGLKVNLPEEFASSKGIIEPYMMGEIDAGVKLMMIFYVGMDQEAYAASAENPNPTEEEKAALMSAMSVLGYVFTIDGNRTAADLIEILDIPTAEEKDFIEVGKAEDVTFYLWLDPSEEDVYVSGLKPEFAEEYSALRSKLADVLKGSEFSVPPVPGSELVGKVLRFETKDIDGNPVKSEDIFSGNEITMVNVWATWCGPCLRELKELGEIDRRLADKDCAILGICIDAEESPDEAKALIKENQMDYLNILPFDDLDDALALEGYPTTVFIGRDGSILVPPIIGVPSDLSRYEETIDALLADKEPAENAG
jgi:thiol-disulfide isomerase/thioredoxin